MPRWRYVTAGAAAAVIVLVGCTAPQTRPPTVDSVAAELEAKKQRVLYLEAFIDTQSRLERVGFPVLQAAVPLCEQKRRHATGAWFWTLEVFPEDLREAASSRFGVTDLVQVGVVREGSPAEAGGLRVGDIPVRVNGWSVPSGPGAFEAFIDHLDELLRQPQGASITFSVKRGHADLDVTVEPVEICDYRLIVERSDAKNAYADGARVVVFQGMMEFLSTDAELATVVSHEVAHNVMGHVEAKRGNAMVGGLLGLALDIAAAAAGLNTQGQLSKLGAHVGAGTYSVAFEQEADYVGLYLMANAGYDVRKAPNLWRKMAIQNPDAIEHRRTHPTTPERFVALEKTVEQIDFKRQMGASLTPEFEARASKRQAAPARAAEN